MTTTPNLKSNSPSSPVKGHSIPRFPLRHRLFRLFWMTVWFLLASWTPPQLNRWRCFLLSLFGAKIASGAVVRSSAMIWYPPNLIMNPDSMIGDGVQCYNMDLIVIGERTIISQRAFLCGGTHDFTRASRPLLTKPIMIDEDVWIAAEAFIGPGVTVPRGCIIGARSVITGRLDPWTIYAGNPAKPLGPRELDQST